jgi:ABC-type branched-subunit amino acid transport system ATPase component
MSGPPVLEVAGVSKRFGALEALREVSLSLASGARHAIIGPNGSGKTTLMKVVSGMLRPNSGRIRIVGQDVTRTSIEYRVRLGLAQTFQISTLFPTLTVLEHVGFALSARNKTDLYPWGRLSRWTDMKDEAEALLERFGLAAARDRLVANLAYGQRRLMELALAVALRPKVLLLDEPAAGLAIADRPQLLAMLKRLPRDVATLLIEHDMSVVFGFAEHVSVLATGSLLVDGTAEEVRRDPRVREIYLGTASHG